MSQGRSPTCAMTAMGVVLPPPRNGSGPQLARATPPQASFSPISMSAAMASRKTARKAESCSWRRQEKGTNRPPASCRNLTQPAASACPVEVLCGGLQPSRCTAQSPQPDETITSALADSNDRRAARNTRQRADQRPSMVHQANSTKLVITQPGNSARPGISSIIT